MSKKMYKISGLFAAVIILAVGFLAVSQPEVVHASSLDRGGPNGGGYGHGTGTAATAAGTAQTPLSAAEEEALQRAILEEYGALDLYQGVIDQFGSVYPFSRIVNSEQQHVNALIRQATRYGVSVPANPGLTLTPSVSTVNEACQAGVAAEIADAALYDELKPDITHTDILNVFSNLQTASLENHLPAFEACQ